MLDEVGALARGPVAQEEIVYQDLVICESALQHPGLPHTCTVCEYRGLPCDLWGGLRKQFPGKNHSALSPQLVMGTAHNSLVGLPDLALNQNLISVRPAVLTDYLGGIWLP